MKLLATLSTACAAAAAATLEPNYTSPAGVEVYNPSALFKPTGPWSLMSRAGDTIYVAGMRGIYPANNTLAPAGIERIRQAYANMIQLAEMAGTDRYSAARLVVYTTDMYPYRPLCNQVQTELWGDDANRHPPRTIVEVQRLNDDDIVEVEGTFLAPAEGEASRGWGGVRGAGEDCGRRKTMNRAMGGEEGY